MTLNWISLEHNIHTIRGLFYHSEGGGRWLRGSFAGAFAPGIALIFLFVAPHWRITQSSAFFIV